MYGQQRTAQLLDDLKTLGFRYATRSGLSICIADTSVKTDREKIIAPGRARRAADQPPGPARAIITDDEARAVRAAPVAAGGGGHRRPDSERH